MKEAYCVVDVSERKLTVFRKFNNEVHVNFPITSFSERTFDGMTELYQVLTGVVHIAKKRGAKVEVEII